MSSAQPAITVADLHKFYDQYEAVGGVSFEVAEGEIFGLRGPTGAGKTTTGEILEGYRDSSSGSVSVLGFNPAERARALRERVGIVLQSSGMYRHVRVREAVTHWAGLYPHPRNVDEVLGIVGLDDEAQAAALVRTLSGGQQRRLDLALALIGDPDLIFLDEPTTGFDPAARRSAWSTVKRLRELGKTVLLTTHYLEEAQELCDRVAIIKNGKILAEGPPSTLSEASARYRVSWRDQSGELVSEEVDDPTELLHRLTGEAIAHGQQLEDCSVVRPSLEDVYLELTADEASEVQQ